MEILDMGKEKIVWYFITTGIFAVLIYFADFQNLVQALIHVKIVYIVLATAFGILTFLFWASIWHVLFESLDIRSGFFRTIRMSLAGNFMNSVTPLGQFGGEPFMAYIVSKNTDASYEKSLSCIISADIMSASPMITYMGAGLVYMLFLGILEDIFVKLVYLTVALMAFGLILVYFIWFGEDGIKNPLFGLLDFLKSRAGFVDKYSDSLKSRILEIEESFNRVGDNPRVIVKGLILSHLAIGAQFVALYLVLLSKGLDPSLTAIFFTVIIAGFSIWAPTPGGSGAYEATFSTVLMLFYSINFDIALTIAILFRIATFWSGIVVGYPAILSLSLDVKEAPSPG